MMRRPSPGIRWLVTHLESITQLLTIMRRREPSGRVVAVMGILLRLPSQPARGSTARCPAGLPAGPNAADPLLTRLGDLLCSPGASGRPICGLACCSREGRRHPGIRSPASESSDGKSTGDQHGPSPAGGSLHRIFGTATGAEHPGAGPGQLRRDRLAPCPPCGLGFSHRGGGRAVDEGPDLLGDGAPVGGGGQLAEYREQAEVDALEDHV